MKQQAHRRALTLNFFVVKLETTSAVTEVRFKTNQDGFSSGYVDVSVVAIRFDQGTWSCKLRVCSKTITINCNWRMWSLTAGAAIDFDGVETSLKIKVWFGVEADVVSQQTINSPTRVLKTRWRQRNQRLWHLNQICRRIILLVVVFISIIRVRSEGTAWTRC